MRKSGRVRDLSLLDLIDAKARTAYGGPAWRVTKEGRDPTQGHPSAGRWDPGTFDVLYTSLARDGALTEVHFHLSLQPVFPSKVKYIATELRVDARAVLIVEEADLATFGISSETFQSRDYTRMQDVGDAACFLGFDSMVVPSARGTFRNLVVFTGKTSPDQISITSREEIDWVQWRATKH